MIKSSLREQIKSYQDFPKQGILFRDLSPLLQHPNLYQELLDNMAKSKALEKADAIIAVDARGFLLAPAIALKLGKPLVLARKSGKLPGLLISNSYNLEYGEDALSIQEESIKKFNTFAIVDDLLATGGTIQCIANIIASQKKQICGCCFAIELKSLKAREKFSFPIYSEIVF